MAINMEYWICPCCGSGFWGKPAGETLCPDCEDFMPAADTPFCPDCGSSEVTRPGFSTDGMTCMCNRCGAVWREVASHA